MTKTTCIYTCTKQKKKCNYKTRPLKTLTRPVCLLYFTLLCLCIVEMKSGSNVKPSRAPRQPSRYHSRDVALLATCSLAGGGPRPLSSPLSCLSSATLSQRWHFIGVPVRVWWQGPGRSKRTEDRALPEASRATHRGRQQPSPCPCLSPFLLLLLGLKSTCKRPLDGHYRGWVKCLWL